MTIERHTWLLPRPRRRDKYPGGFPMHFEKKLLELLGIDPKRHKILHPFGGMAEFGDRVDLRDEVNPTFFGDAHDLSFIDDDTYDLVILDPPYNDEQSKKLYNTGKVKFGAYMAEAVRVCKPGGLIAVYHWVWTPRPKGCGSEKMIVIITRVWHRPRVCCISRKDLR